MAPKMGRASVPAESVGAGLFRHIIFTRGRTGKPYLGSHFAPDTSHTSCQNGCRASVPATIRVAVFDQQQGLRLFFR